MPLLPKRRSTLDLLTSELRANRAERDNVDRSDTPTERAPSLSLPRPRSAHDLPTGVREFGQRSDSPPMLDAKPAKRFSMRLSRHFSDSQLSARVRAQAEQEERPPVPAIPSEPSVSSIAPLPPPPPTILTTAPTGDVEPSKKKTRGIMFMRQKSQVGSIKSLSSFKAQSPIKEESKGIFNWGRKSQETRRTNANRTSITSADDTQQSPRPESPGLAPPQMLKGRKSTDLKRKSLFGLPKKEKKPLFPLPVKIEAPPQYPDTAPATPRESTSNLSHRSGSPVQKHSPVKRNVDGQDGQTLHGSASQAALARGNVTFAPPGYPLIRNDSNRSTPSTHSSPNMGPPRKFGIRDRASTNSTFGRPSEDITPPTPPTLSGSTRNSTSTGGRASLGGFLTLGRFRGTDANGAKYDSPSGNSKQNSMTISRDTMALPEKLEGETAAKYLERLQGLASRNVVAAMLSKSTDTFFQNVLRSYTRRFAFFGEPIDMSLRKFLLEAELPKETQQVDRVMQAFADRYHECNPGIFLSPDEAYVVAFSLMMLHTDAFNKNNKYKMQKNDYIKNTRGQHVSEDILACFYDNICYTPFIHFDEDDFDAGSDRLSTFKSKKAKLKGAMPDPTKKSSGPVDPYSLIIDNKLDALRPSLKDSIVLEDPYNYLGTAHSLDLLKVHKKFQFGGVLQIISARSRPAAFESQASRDNPEESKPGVVDLQVTKVGILWRKSAKRKKARSPWQEWGAILTGSQLYFFKNTSWIKNLMQQYQSHQKHMVPPSSVIFKPPLEEFKPDSLIKTDDAVALVDSTYNRHKNAFTLVRHGGEEEVLLADNESELNEWLALVNYAAAFRSAGVRIRGFAGNNAMEANPIALRRTGTNRTVRAGDEGHHRSTSMNPQLAKQIMAARRRQIIAKIAEAEIKLSDDNKALEDMLRNARHLLILAPIQPRSREVVIHSAAKMDAQMKWTRRDIWRTKCYKDILYLDALEDTDDIKDEASKMRPISLYPPADEPIELEPTIQTENIESDESSPPSPIASTRPQTMSSGIIIPDEDVFRTPPESARAGDNWSWKLPPLEINAHAATQPPVERHASVSSAVPSTVSAGRPSYTQVSSTSSVADLSRLSSATPVERPLSQLNTATSSNPITPASSQKRETLATSLTATTASSARRLSDAAANLVHSTPDSNGGRTRSHRKSLHRTLRDGFHEGPGSIHRHRKGKESASTVKSDATYGESEDVPEGTPGLERREGRFILHGKQASVITFGEGWDGVMRMPTSIGADGLVPHEDETTPVQEPSISNGTTETTRDHDPEKDSDQAAAHDVVIRDMQPADKESKPSSPDRKSRPQSMTADAEAAALFVAGLKPSESLDSLTSGRTGSFFDAKEKDSADDLSRITGTPDRRSRASLPDEGGDLKEEVQRAASRAKEQVEMEQQRLSSVELRRLSTRGDGKGLEEGMARRVGEVGV
ncbi:Arf guanine nucleotide exchange factor sec74 [Sphaceloma murrayae]|uniref:Arf guanine nucleotide exchange factor sec74 n=1 Tax=Sphaceloma murrayae TaxID=2082308 RepID=A0A2K1QX45_9PEZI|nr:Arf guanine nucleotide exchange factor sec74 [Sphaceloma murrayae]